MSGDGIEPGKLFIGGLSWETKKEGLIAYFSTYGEVEDVAIMKDATTDKPRGFGFVTFVNPQDAATVCASGPHKLDGKFIDPKPAYNKQQSVPPQTGPTKKVFVGGIPGEANEDHIRALFSEYKVTDVDIKIDKTTNRNRGFGFVTFETEASVEELCGQRYVKFADDQFNGKQVEVKKAEVRKPAPFGSNQGMMGGSYQNQGYGGGYNGAMYPSAGQPYQRQHQQQYEGYGYSAGYGGSYGGAHAGGYGGAASYSYPQSGTQQPVNSYQDQSYGAAGYNTSRTDTASYSQQQYPGYQQQQQQQQGYTNTAGNTGYSSRGQQPQSSYGYGGGHGLH